MVSFIRLTDYVYKHGAEASYVQRLDQLPCEGRVDVLLAWQPLTYGSVSGHVLVVVRHAAVQATGRGSGGSLQSQGRQFVCHADIPLACWDPNCSGQTLCTTVVPGPWDYHGILPGIAESQYF